VVLPSHSGVFLASLAIATRAGMDSMQACFSKAAESKCIWVSYAGVQQIKRYPSHMQVGRVSLWSLTEDQDLVIVQRKSTACHAFEKFLAAYKTSSMPSSTPAPPGSSFNHSSSSTSSSVSISSSSASTLGAISRFFGGSLRLCSSHAA